jgi:hypothetical protein
MTIATDYDATWVTLYQKRTDLLEQRSSLEAELSNVNTQIEHLNEILKHLSPLVGLPAEANLASLGITNAIRWILEQSEDRMSPTEIRDKLIEKGFDLSALSAPMNSIYKILSRLADGDKPEVTRQEEDRKVFYSWIRKESDAPF